MDSSLLLAAALDALGERALAVTVDLPLVPRRDLEQARRQTRELGARHEVASTEIMQQESFLANPPERCYLCKSHLFALLRRLADENRLEGIVEGSNRDDQEDFRPGRRAAEEAGARMPLRELGWGKETVRALAKWRGLSAWDRPASACLATRLPFGERLEADVLARIERAEDFLLELGISPVRVRCHKGLARIETNPLLIGKLIGDPLRGRVYEFLRRLGFSFVTVDLEGYRTGSLNPPR